MHDIEDVLPQVVVCLDMSIKAAFRVLVEDEPLKVADKANIVHVFVVLLLLISQGCERVHNNSEDNVQADDVDHNLERGVVN